MPIVTPWICRVWQEFNVGNLTRTHRDVLLTLRTYRGPGGIAWPAHATLAERVGCSVRTVQRALGLVTWHERRRRHGWRSLRSSNAYRLSFPESPVLSGLRPRRRAAATAGQSARGGEREDTKSRKAALSALLSEAATAPDLLLARQQAIAKRLLMNRTGLALPGT